MALTDAPAAFSASAPDVTSILKEISPGSPVAAPSKAPATGRLPLHLALGIPSPARAGAKKNFQGGSQLKNMPYGPPAHSPAPLAEPLVPPPPQFLAAPACHAPQEQQPPTMTMLDPSATSYRERLRAGGRGAFQRALDAGLAPKGMKQEWSGLQAPSAPARGFLPKQQPECQSAAMMQCQGDAQRMWNGTGQMQSNDGWCSPMNQPHMNQLQMQSQQPYVPQQMMSQSMPPQMPPQVFQDQAQQQAQLMQGGQSPHMPQMAAPQMQADLNRCMAIVMPQPAQFEGDRELMALQLKAAAELQQCYQD